MTPAKLNIILLIISFVLYYYVVSPLYFGTDSFFVIGDNISTLQQKSKTLDKTIAAYAVLEKQAKDSLNAYNNISPEDKQKIMVMVPEQVDDIKLMSELTNIGIASGVPIEGMGVKDKEGSYLISFSVTTTYDNFKKVMATWENSRRLLSLKSFTFAPGKTNDDKLKFTIELVAYYLK